jgi:uncharacterized protein YceK
MRCERIFLAATALAALGLAGCDTLKSLTEPPDGLTGLYTFTLSTTMSNSAGAATILDAQLLIDNNVVADSCPEEYVYPVIDSDGNVTYSCNAPAVATADLSASGHIGPGMHTLWFFMSSETARSQPYTVKAFTIQVFDPSGHLSKSIDLPTQSAGESITYQITI